MQQWVSRFARKVSILEKRTLTVVPHLGRFDYLPVIFCCVGTNYSLGRNFKRSLTYLPGGALIDGKHKTGKQQGFPAWGDYGIGRSISTVRIRSAGRSATGVVGFSAVGARTPVGFEGLTGGHAPVVPATHC